MMSKIDPIEEFKKEVAENIRRLGNNKELKALALRFMVESIEDNYSYNFRWLGCPIIQHPQDIVAIQELIWEIKPELVIETGIAHGGSLILSASILELIGHGEVLGIDIDIREHNRIEIEKHPMSNRISMIQGSSIDEGTFPTFLRIPYDKNFGMVKMVFLHQMVYREFPVQFQKEIQKVV